ncbi:alpha/beta hydrolase family protein [Paractinoplanes rishiriensis]|uniref:Alpha/beta hydrolase n=1 Tax=Paractinoplanes rishiriensis TaxID=1050105 RepID=A0A919K489_9ACTN|nr:phthalyl amidase [Actinoplanes rishiriensis]GIE98547.1 alpha/beta hydrolase [Actinoplanes rishiriensis]
MTNRWKYAATAFALVVSLAAAPAPAQAAALCEAPVPSPTQPGYLITDPDCSFTPLDGARAYTGIRDGAAYRIEVPQRWNGKLVVYAHGYRGQGTTVYVSNPELRAHYLAEGYAWAASSYATNGYDVGQGVRDSYALIRLFREVTGHPAGSVIMSGASMGGHVTAVAIETYPRAFDGAMPYCGVLGDTELFDYFLDANVTAAALAGVDIEFPLSPAADYPARYAAQLATIKPALGPLTPAGRTWSAVVERRSGGERPGFDGAFAYWSAAPSGPPLTGQPFLFGLYPGLSGGTANIAPGNVTDNRHTFYRSTDQWLPTAAEWRLNREVLRVHRTARADRGLNGIPRVDGAPRVPVLSLHTIGDLFVPISMEQEYAERAARNGKSRLFVSRAIRGNGHCEFTQAELIEGFNDLTKWIRTGHRPPGDAIRNPRVVAAPEFGCRFTRGAHAGFAAPACP